MRLLFIVILSILAQQCSSQRTSGIVDFNQSTLTIFKFVTDSLVEYSLICCDSNINRCIKQNTENSLICSSDFNGNGNKDYAILLRNNSNEVCLFIFSIINENIEYSIIDCFGIWQDEEIDDLKLKVEPKGKWESVDSTIKVPFDGILVEDLRESLSISYYWNNGDFTRFLYD